MRRLDRNKVVQCEGVLCYLLTSLRPKEVFQCLKVSRVIISGLFFISTMQGLDFFHPRVAKNTSSRILRPMSQEGCRASSKIIKISLRLQIVANLRIFNRRMQQESEYTHRPISSSFTFQHSPSSKPTVSPPRAEPGCVCLLGSR